MGVIALDDFAWLDGALDDHRWDAANNDLDDGRWHANAMDRCLWHVGVEKGRKAGKISLFCCMTYKFYGCK